MINASGKKITAMGWAIIGLLVLNLGWASREYIFPPNPYNNVSVVSLERGKETLKVEANFTKLGCDFVRLDVVGIANEATAILNWEDNFSLPPDHDRAKGSQTLSITINLPDINFERVEIRTRHNCDGLKVDKVFLTIPMSNITQSGDTL